MFRSCCRFLNTKLPSVNCINLVGVAHDVQAGYVGTDLILQFQLVCNYLPVANDQVPIINPLTPSTPPNAAASASSSPIEREYFTVRVSGNLNDIKTQLNDGSVVSLQGQFKMNMQPEPLVDHKMMPFPYIAVKLSGGAENNINSTDFVEILHGKGIHQNNNNASSAALGKSTVKK